MILGFIHKHKKENEKLKSSREKDRETDEMKSGTAEAYEEMDENGETAEEISLEQDLPTEDVQEIKIEDLLEENSAITDKLLRLAAEFDNYKKRTQREKESLSGEIKAAVILKALPILDNLERAAESPDADAQLLQDGLKLILKQFEDFLAYEGVSEIEAQGREFDPSVHNAVMHDEDDEFGKNMVAEVFQKGYKLGENRVIRYSSVKVVN